MLRKKAIAHLQDLVSALPFRSNRQSLAKSNSPMRRTPALIPGRAREPRIETRNRIPPWCERATARAARVTARSSATRRWAPARCFLFWRATPTTRRCPDRTPNRVSPTRAAATMAPRRPRADAPRCTARCSSPTRPSRRSLTSPWGGRSSRCVRRNPPLSRGFFLGLDVTARTQNPGFKPPDRMKHPPFFLSNASMPSARGRANAARLRVSGRTGGLSSDVSAARRVTRPRFRPDSRRAPDSPSPSSSSRFSAPPPSRLTRKRRRRRLPASSSPAWWPPRWSPSAASAPRTPSTRTPRPPSTSTWASTTRSPSPPSARVAWRRRRMTSSSLCPPPRSPPPWRRRGAKSRVGPLLRRPRRSRPPGPLPWWSCPPSTTSGTRPRAQRRARSPTGRRPPRRLPTR